MITAFLVLILGYLQSPGPRDIVKDWITTQNSGNYEAFLNFMERNYEPGLMDTLAMDAHAAFLDAFYQDNGGLMPFIYEQVPSKDYRLEFHLLKEGANAIVPASEDIVIVRMELDPKSLKLLKPLELTLLVCEQKGTYEN